MYTLWYTLFPLHWQNKIQSCSHTLKSYTTTTRRCKKTSKIHIKQTNTFMFTAFFRLSLSGFLVCHVFICYRIGYNFSIFLKFNLTFVYSHFKCKISNRSMCPVFFGVCCIHIYTWKRCCLSFVFVKWFKNRFSTFWLDIYLIRAFKPEYKKPLQIYS